MRIGEGLTRVFVCELRREKTGVFVSSLVQSPMVDVAAERKGTR